MWSSGGGTCVTNVTLPGASHFLIEEERTVWSRTDATHVPAEHVDDLGQVFEMAQQEQSSDPGQRTARIAIPRGVELQRRIDPSGSDAPPPYEDGPRALAFDCDGDENHEGKRQNQERARRHQIYRLFCRTLQGAYVHIDAFLSRSI
jgi:hypothetical protein